MKPYIATLLFFFLFLNVYAQKKPVFTFVNCIEIKAFSDGERERFFGGISAIELVDQSALKKSFEEIHPIHPIQPQTGEQVFLLVADKYKREGKSFAFTMGADYKLRRAYCLPDKAVNFESIRYSKYYKNFFYSFERDDSTGVGYMEAQKLHTIHAVPAICDTASSDNRGIEGITLSDDNRLWMAFESGGGTDTSKVETRFLRMELDTIKRIRAARIDRYFYPLKKGLCLKPEACDTFDWNCGNGISEILAIAGQPDKLLVLERCFNNKKATSSSASQR